MKDLMTSFLRSMNARLVGEERWIVQKFYKVFYALSVVLYKNSAKPSSPAWIVIGNFDRDVKIKIDRSRSIGAAIYWTGFHEFHELLFLNRFLTRDMVFADVGANLGEYTLFAAKRVKNGKVLSFEPMPKMTALLQENIKLNGFQNVRVMNYGLSDKEATLPIHEIEGADDGLSTFFIGDLKSRGTTEASLKALDAVAGELGIQRIDFIKMDIEGAELYALRGAVNTIRKYRPTMMVEINSHSYKSAGYSVEDIFKFFSDLSYQAYEIKKQGELVPLNSIPQFKNVVFRPS